MTTVAPPETACEQTLELHPVRVRSYGKHSDTRYLDDVTVSVWDLLADAGHFPHSMASHAAQEVA
jgi:hypothetical protein